MCSYIIRRMLALVPVLLAVLTLVFFLLHLIPGDPVDLILGEQVLTAERAAFVSEFGFDRPVWQQYFTYLKGLAANDWGRSYFTHQPVLEMIQARVGATVLLTVIAMFVAVLLATPIGVISALKRDSFWDSCAMFLSLLGISIPNFWLGPVLALIFSVQLGWLPIAGRESFASLVLPAVTLGTALAAMLSRMTRASMLEEIKKEYVTTARAKGLSEKKIIFKHAFRNALNPIVTIIGLQVGTLLAGAIITEKIFAWPGIGTLLLESIGRRDYAVVQGCILLIAVVYVLVNTLTDCMYKAIDPRVRL